MEMGQGQLIQTGRLGLPCCGDDRRRFLKEQP